MSALEVSMMKRIGELNAEIKLRKAEVTDCKAESDRLKAEVERLTALVESNLNSSKVAMGKADAVLHERDSLKAEVERWKGNHAVVIEDRNTVLSSLVNMKAEVERLREAGDALAAWTLALEHTYDHKPMDGLPFSSFLCVWHEAAKEGKPNL